MSVTTTAGVATDAKPKAGNRYTHIDAMRAAAVMLVVLAHAGLGSYVPGGSGVTIFFSISGFIITFLVMRERDKTGGFGIGSFYVRRFLKIFPPLILAILVPSLLYSLFNPIDWDAVLAQTFFYYNWYKVDGGADILPGTGVVWSLSIEEQFYIVFAIIWVALVRYKYWRPVIIAISLFCVLYSTIARVLLFSAESSHDRIYYGSDTRLDGIAWGILAACWYHSWLTRGSPETRVSRIAGKSAFAVVAVLLYVSSLVVRDEFFRETFRYSVQSVAACMLIVYGLMSGTGRFRQIFDRVCASRVVAVIGIASYSIYLAHLVVALLLDDLLSGLPNALASFIAASVGVGVGIGMYYLIEVPVLKWRTSVLKV
ncbi:acyltransferase family protein [Rhodococcus hoagii]|nr:acyltransferase family protein [Prescottella equi]NKZ89476.1 acyltransferase family protein [Prescottella equi]